MQEIDTIIFDLGGVLVDWNPEYLYVEVFNGDKKKADWFLNEICTHDWNIEQDAGRSFQEATEMLAIKYPEYEAWIRMYYDRWEDMLGGAIEETVVLLNKLKRANTHRLYALTNWSAETFPIAVKRFEFLNHFEGILVSGEEKTRKPFPKIYEIMLERYQINPVKSVFIDDNFKNSEAAKKLGIHGIHYKTHNDLINHLQLLQIKF